MPNDYFKFKQFTIYQDRCAMKVGTDGVLLGAWANCENAKTVLDIGTGTGLIALMIAQRSKALIDAIEIDNEAVSQAQENVDKSVWVERINIINQSFQTFQGSVDSTYDLIVSNPPYFQNSLFAPDQKRTNARHNANLELEELIIGTKKLLNQDGNFTVILPYLEGNMFIVKAAELGLYCIRQTKVLPKPNREPKRLLLEFAHIKKPLVEQEIIIELNKRHEYSEAYKNLTKDFYLAF
ncbi:MAG: tRNA (adenosine(37)-N6)-methyltransferase TrmM [Marinilabiliales bacterium]|nr:MAG: tRNA (adenosine(37)-N6)-methyltransferase TrmM [Marinilabiliales bacterium]